ncbi:MAG: hypothetical protein ACK4K9_09895 [Bacteroidia bacterium]
MISIKNIPIYITAFLIILGLTLFTNELGWIAQPIVLLVIVVAFVYLLLNRLEPNAIYKKPKLNIIPLVLFLIGNVFIIFVSWQIFSTNPIDEKYSDIIPLIEKIYLNRMFSGEEVYQVIEGFGYGTWYPNYLPMHWLPFSISFLFGFDSRYVALAVLLLANGYYFLVLSRFKLHIAESILKTLLPFILMVILFFKQTSETANTIEFLTSGYYMLLGSLLIVSSNGITKAFSLMFTSLSRYVVVFILPALLFTDIKFKRKDTLLVYILFVFLILIIYAAPFLQEDPLVFFKGAKAYDTAALGEWDGQDWQKSGDKPFQLFRGFGFASWFYSFSSGDLISKIQLNKFVLLIIMLVNTLVWMTTYSLVKNKFMLQSVMLFFSLFIFFSFVMVPYNYLFWNVLFLMPVLLLPVKLLNVT